MTEAKLQVTVDFNTKSVEDAIRGIESSFADSIKESLERSETRLGRVVREFKSQANSIDKIERSVKGFKGFTKGFESKVKGIEDSLKRWNVTMEKREKSFADITKERKEEVKKIEDLTAKDEDDKSLFEKLFESAKETDTLITSIRDTCNEVKPRYEKMLEAANKAEKTIKTLMDVGTVSRHVQDEKKAKEREKEVGAMSFLSPENKRLFEKLLKPEREKRIEELRFPSDPVEAVRKVETVEKPRTLVMEHGGIDYRVGRKKVFIAGQKGFISTSGVTGLDDAVKDFRKRHGHELAFEGASHFGGGGHDYGNISFGPNEGIVVGHNEDIDRVMKGLTDLGKTPKLMGSRPSSVGELAPKTIGPLIGKKDKDVELSNKIDTLSKLIKEVHRQVTFQGDKGKVSKEVNDFLNGV